MYKKFIVLCSLLFLLNACGFRPMYSNGNNNKNLATIKVGNINAGSVSRDSLQLKDALEQELLWSSSDSPKYQLDVTYSIHVEAVAIQANTVTTRNNLQITLDYKLIDIATSAKFSSGQLIGIESYDIQASPFTNYVSKEETALRLLRNLATELRLRIA